MRIAGLLFGVTPTLVLVLDSGYKSGPPIRAQPAQGDQSVPDAPNHPRMPASSPAMMGTTPTRRKAGRKHTMSGTMDLTPTLRALAVAVS